MTCRVSSDVRSENASGTLLNVPWGSADRAGGILDDEDSMIEPIAVAVYRHVIADLHYPRIDRAAPEPSKPCAR
jgi:hypothetical protein